MAKFDDLIKELSDKNLSNKRREEIVAELEKITGGRDAEQQKKFQAANKKLDGMLGKVDQAAAMLDAGFARVTAVDSSEVDALMGQMEQESLNARFAAIGQPGSKGKRRSDSPISNSSSSSDPSSNRASPMSFSSFGDSEELTELDNEYQEFVEDVQKEIQDSKSSNGKENAEEFELPVSYSNLNAGANVTAKVDESVAGITEDLRNFFSGQPSVSLGADSELKASGNVKAKTNKTVEEISEDNVGDFFSRPSSVSPAPGNNNSAAPVPEPVPVVDQSIGVHDQSKGFFTKIKEFFAIFSQVVSIHFSFFAKKPVAHKGQARFDEPIDTTPPAAPVTPAAQEKPKGIFASFVAGFVAGIKTFSSGMVNLFNKKKEPVNPAVEQVVAQAKVLHQKTVQVIEGSQQARQQVREHTRQEQKQSTQTATNSFTSASRGLGVDHFTARQSIARKQESKQDVAKPLPKPAPQLAVQQNKDQRVVVFKQKVNAANAAVNNSTLKNIPSQLKAIKNCLNSYIANAKQYPDRESYGMKAAEKRIKEMTEKALANPKPSNQASSAPRPARR